jgi:hypothetical protein
MSSAAAIAQQHIHLPSVHIRGENSTGFDYEEDLYVSGRGRRRRVHRVVRLTAIEHGAPSLVRETYDELCMDEIAQLEEGLPVLMDEGNPAASASMEECARNEFARQLRIAAGEEQVCRRCGCSETRACSGGCIWANDSFCSRCVSSDAEADRFLRSRRAGA